VDTRSFVIPATNKSMVEEHILKLNKRAAKLSLPEITLTWGKAFLQSQQVKGLKVDVLVIPVDVTGPLSVSYEGWKFLATLQHLPTGENIIRTITDSGWIVPSVYHTSGSQCEHCQVNRYRKDTYLVVREDDGKTFQVGSSCIKDFLGGNSPDDLLKRAALVAELMDFMSNSSHGGIGSNNEGLYHIQTFLEHTVACIREYGWVSKSEAKTSGEKATAACVLDNLEMQYINLSLDDKEKAQQALEWTENLSDEDCEFSDYLHNIRAIARAGIVGLRTMGFAASIISAYDKDVAKRQPKLISSHVGHIKMREEFDLTLKDMYHGHSTYGGFTKYTFHDDYGNVFIWTSSVIQNDLELNNKYKIIGTVKAHTEFKGIKQTEINRCKIEMYYERIN
jgi:hypothetical protein